MALGALDEAVVVGGGASSAVASQEEPVLASDGDPAQGLFGRVVVDVEYPVIEIAGERGPVVHRIGDGLADGTLGQDGGLLLDEPLLKAFAVHVAVEQGSGVLVAQGMARRSVKFFGFALDGVEPANPGERAVGAVRVRRARPVELASAMGPARPTSVTAPPT